MFSKIYELFLILENTIDLDLACFINGEEISSENNWSTLIFLEIFKFKLFLDCSEVPYLNGDKEVNSDFASLNLDFTYFYSENAYFWGFNSKILSYEAHLLFIFDSEPYFATISLKVTLASLSLRYVMGKLCFIINLGKN